MTVKYLYTKPAGLSLLVHGALFCLALLVTGQAASSSAPEPPPIEIAIEPSRLIDTGAGKLHLTSGSPRPVKTTKPRVRIAAAKPAAPKPVPSEPAPAAAPTTLDQLPPPLPGEVSADSVAVPQQGDTVTAGGERAQAVHRGEEKVRVVEVPGPAQPRETQKAEETMSVPVSVQGRFPGTLSPPKERGGKES